MNPLVILCQALEEAAAALASDVRLGSRAPLLREGTTDAAVTTCEAASSALTSYLQPPPVVATETAAGLATAAMTSIDFFAPCLDYRHASNSPTAAAMANELRVLSDAISAENIFWKDYSSYPTGI